MLALIRLVKENEDVTLVTIGPLTNVAMAYKLDPNFEKNLKKLVVLGGNYFGKKHENWLMKFFYLSNIIVKNNSYPRLLGT